MITEIILNSIKNLLLFVFNILPDTNLSLPDGLITWLSNIFSASAYFLPLADFLLMFSIFVVVTNWTVIWRILQRVWDALPFT